MEGKQQRGRGRGRGPRQVQDQEEKQGSVANQSQGPGGEERDQIVTAINRITSKVKCPNVPPPKFGRGTGGVRISGTPRGAPSRGAQNRREQQRIVSQGALAPAPRVSYGYCGKTHHIEYTCWRKMKKCLRCGSSEHQIATYLVKTREENEGLQLEKSNPKQPTASGSRPKVSARVYALDHQRAPESSEKVVGMIPVFHRLAKLLIDPGATHSFVNPTFMYGIDVNPVKLPYDLKVRTPTEDQSLITNIIYKNCEVWVRERKLIVDLINLDLKGYDVIMGMDWLARYNI
ncbi:uncharacterized protein LOC113759924 [Coffea eugenioides]|uniref:uncharacterized protein LOC113759924 n=1 Tax=Coffea eugenioides TaxID=49369 RepID=UPI000F612BDF|nr:uncharacterized protein LOC113759924 [Coffea eugenioides]